ncbi:cation/H(+) antiporter [Kribbella antibiotica]|uniref:Cation/H(+) antiporter n=1 Tax=Kribbella antibiotica TaxID=190195 RepID=A0A4R4ZJQ1_9ACTN|nr:cation:proton antiporter [Kribbella antibiotica]TDD58873.1 cation/H(+) antiporter [Kribbella antibiotica]
MPTLLQITTHLSLQLAVVLLTYRLLWQLFRRLRQVQVVAILVAGFLLGPSALGLAWPAAQQWLFPIKLIVGGQTIMHPNLIAIYVIGQLGLILYMFLVGSSFSLDVLRSHRRQATATSTAGVAVPMLLGAVVGWWMVGQGRYFTDRIANWQGALFVAAAIAVTAFPILAWIIYDSGLTGTRLGTMSLACAAVDDACAWILLAVVVATAQDSPGGAYLAAGGGVAYLLFMALIGRRLLARLNTWKPRADDTERTGGLPVGPFVVVLVVVLLAASFTDFIGIHSVLGAFVAGLCMPRGELIEQIRQRLEPVVGYLLLPAYFVYTGLNTQLDLIFEPKILAVTALVLAVSFAGKFGAIGLVARSQGMGWREAGAMGALANARGLMELVLLNIGLSAGLITAELYTILALMTVVTTIAATPLQRMFERNAWKNGIVFGPTGEEPQKANLALKQRLRSESQRVSGP